MRGADRRSARSASAAPSKGAAIRVPVRRIARIASTVLLIACCALALRYSIKQVSAFPRWLVDDAYINFRYAENLAERGELNWNVGEDPVEGYTGVALVWLLSMAIRLGIDPGTAVHVIGVFFYFLGAGLMFLIFRGGNLASTVAFVLYLTAPFLLTHVWSGLETVMFVTLILLAIYAFTARAQRLLIASLLLLSLTRPEGILLSLILLALFRPLTRALVLMYLVPFGIYYLWRWGYYGQFFPNTFYAKFSVEAEEKTWTALRGFFTSYLRWPLLLAFVLATRETIRRNIRLIAGVTVFVAVCLGVHLSSKLVMNYAYRFFVPLYVLALLALGGSVSRAKLDAKALILIVALTAPQLSANLDKDRMKALTEYASSYKGMLEEEHVKAGLFLGETLPPGEWLVVHADAGAIPYYSRMKTLDCGRLNDEYLTDTDLPLEQVCDYVFSRRPAAMVFTSTTKKELHHGPEADAITHDERFGEFRLVKRYSSRHWKRYHEFVYLRADLADSLGMAALDPARPEPPSSDHASPGPAGNAPGTSELTEPGELETLDDLRHINARREEQLTARDDHGGPDGLWAYAEQTENRKIRRTVLEKYLRLYPDDPRAPEVLWALSTTVDDPAERIEYLRRLFETYPDDENAPKALFMIGFIYSEELGEIEKARTVFMQCIEKYPGTESAETAAAMLSLVGENAPKFE